MKEQKDGNMISEAIKSLGILVPGLYEKDTKDEFFGIAIILSAPAQIWILKEWSFVDNSGFGFCIDTENLQASELTYLYPPKGIKDVIVDYKVCTLAEHIVSLRNLSYDVRLMLLDALGYNAIDLMQAYLEELVIGKFWSLTKTNQNMMLLALAVAAFNGMDDSKRVKFVSGLEFTE